MRINPTTTPSQKLPFAIRITGTEWRKTLGRPVQNQVRMCNTIWFFTSSVPVYQPFYPITPTILCMAIQARASHILVKTEDEANKIMKRINDGEDFAAVAKRFSSCPSRKDGGDLGWFGKGQMVPEFEKVAFENDAGKVVGPVKTQFGYHIIKVTGRK
jgi:peptidyl-prolyl cis-trans isomerase C